MGQDRTCSSGQSLGGLFGRQTTTAGVVLARSAKAGMLLASVLGLGPHAERGAAVAVTGRPRLRAMRFWHLVTEE